MRNYRSLKIKVFTSDCQDYQLFSFEPPQGKIWFEQDLMEQMSLLVHQLKAEFKGHDFQVTRKGPGRYNLVPFAVPQAAESAEEPPCLQA